MKLVAKSTFSWLPGFLRRRLDPFEAAIEEFVARVAGELSPGSAVLDAGAGETRHAPFFKHQLYIPVDSRAGDAAWNYSNLSAVADLHRLPLREETCDAVLCVVVLEHVRDPRAVLCEFRRVLKPGCRLWLVTPLLWEEHQKPHDYFRYTSDGIRELLLQAGFRPQEIRPVGGFFWVLGRRCINLLTFFQKGWRWPIFVLLAPLFGLLLPLLCHGLDRLDTEQHFTLGHRTIAIAG